MQGCVAALVFNIYKSAPVKKEFDRLGVVLLGDRMQGSFAVIISGIHISSPIEKEFDHLEVAIVSSMVEDRPAKKGIARYALDTGIGIGPGIEQSRDRFNISFFDSAI
jgi:hypothetical protein